jgi:anti-sigma regulatory factor (Ser/Thr protein kinase)
VTGSFAHEALLYRGIDGFLDGAVPFIREGLDAEEPVLVAVPGRRMAALREALGDRDRLRLVDMTDLGRNPARIIAAWRDFLREADATRRPVRGVGEPLWAGRSADEVEECQHHEGLLNLAFADGPAWRLLCPYDADALDDEVLDAARRTHPLLREAGGVVPSGAYGPPPDAQLETDLPAPPVQAERLAISRAALAGARARVARAASAQGLGAERTADLVLAVSEVASNSITHGGGEGTLALWREADDLVCEVRDDGHIADPLAGRTRPTPDQRRGRGLWLVHELCDLVQVRSRPDGGSVVRMRMRLEPASPERPRPAGAGR